MDGSFSIGESQKKFNPADALKILTKSFANLMKMEIDNSNKNLKKFKKEEALKSNSLQSGIPKSSDVFPGTNLAKSDIDDFS